MVKEAFESGVVDKELNKTLICLVPKVCKTKKFPSIPTD